MKNIYKSIILIILIFSILNFKISNADFFEKTFKLKTNQEKLFLDFHTIKNYNLKDSQYRKQNLVLLKIHPLIKKQILKQYKNGKFNYYKTQGIIKHYRNFIYYADKYFESLKDKEKYGNTPEVKRNIYKNFLNMKSYYYKFKNSLTK